MAVTQQDIAKRLGVSQRLISYALNGHACVGEEMRQRIKEEAESLGYRPHRAAQALVTGKTYQVALCLPILGSSFNNEIIRQFEMLARPTPFDLLIVTFDPDSKSFGNVQFTADGAIFVGAGYNAPHNVGVPLVILQNQLNMPCTLENKTDSVQLNIEAASFDTMRHLLAQGYRRIAYCAPDGMIGGADYRWHAFETCMKEAGLKPEVISLPIPGEELIRQHSHQKMKTYFQEKGFPDAVFCCNDDIGIGAYRALFELGRDIPEGTAVVGFDDLDYARYQHPPMTSIYMPIEEICRRAWEMLMTRIDNPDSPVLYEEFTARLVIRESTQGKSKPTHT